MKHVILILSLATVALSAHAGRRDNIVSHYPTPRYTAPDSGMGGGNDVIYSEELNPLYVWLRHGYNFITGTAPTKPKEGTPR